MWTEFKWLLVENLCTHDNEFLHSEIARNFLTNREILILPCKAWHHEVSWLTESMCQ
jgi:hypothetical protein